MESKAITPFWCDKGLLVAILGPILAVVGSKLGLNLNADELVGIILPVVVYIIGHKWRSGAVAIAEIKAAAKADVAAAPPAASPAAALSEAAK